MAAAIYTAILATSRLLPLPSANGAIANMPSVCLFHQLTGLPCPGCGLTRSFDCVAHGRLGEALAYHPLGPLFFVGVVVAFIVSLLKLAIPQICLPSLNSRIARHASFVMLGIVLAFWVARLGGWNSLPGGAG